MFPRQNTSEVRPGVNSSIASISGPTWKMDHSQHSLHEPDQHLAHSSEHILGSTPTINPVSHGGDGPHAMHHMSFHGGFNEVILFDQWEISSVGGLLGSMLVIFLVSLLYEGLKYYREYLFWKTHNVLGYKPVAVPEPDRNREEENGTSTSTGVHFAGDPVRRQQPSMMTLMHLYQTLLHFVQITLSFALMLVFMTYNVWLCLALVLGATTGYFLFCWKKSVFIDVTETCH